jgi:hypothetical protein
MTQAHSSNQESRGALHTLFLPLDQPIERDGITVIQYADGHPDTLEPLGNLTVSDDSYARLWAPPWFRVRVERDDLSHVEMTVGKVDGRHRCLAINVLSDPQNPSGYIDGDSLRRLRLPSLVREAVELVTYDVMAIYDDPDVLDWVRSFLTANVAKPEEFDPTSVRPGDFLRMPSFLPSQFHPEGYERYVRPDIERAYAQQEAHHPTDDEFVRAWQEASAKDEDVQNELSRKFGVHPGSVRNRAVRLRKKGYDLPSRRGRKPA